MEVKRGDLITATLPGGLGKPRPALVIQSDFFANHTTVAVLPITSATARDRSLLVRLAIEPSVENGLRKPSFVMVDKAMSIRTERLGSSFGRLSDTDMTRINRALALFLGIA